MIRRLYVPQTHIFAFLYFCHVFYHCCFIRREVRKHTCMILICRTSISYFFPFSTFLLPPSVLLSLLQTDKGVTKQEALRHTVLICRTWVPQSFPSHSSIPSRSISRCSRPAGKWYTGSSEEENQSHTFQFITQVLLFSFFLLRVFLFSRQRHLFPPHLTLPYSVFSYPLLVAYSSSYSYTCFLILHYFSLSFLFVIFVIHLSAFVMCCLQLLFLSFWMFFSFIFFLSFQLLFSVSYFHPQCLLYFLVIFFQFVISFIIFFLQYSCSCCFYFIYLLFTSN